jgi:hypothetical protein
MQYVGLSLIGPQGQKIEIISFLDQFNMYQAKETKNNITTTPLLTKSDIKELLQKQDEIKNDIEKMNKMRQDQKEQEEKEKTEYEFCYGYTDNMNHLKKGKVLKILNKEIKFNGKYIARKHVIKELINQGYKTNIIDKMIVGERKINGERKASFKHNVPIIEKENDFYIITKTEYDFANYLINETSL